MDKDNYSIYKSLSNISLRKLFKALVRKKYIILIFSIIGLLVGLYSIKLAKKQFKGEINIVFEEKFQPQNRAKFIKELILEDFYFNGSVSRDLGYRQWYKTISFDFVGNSIIVRKIGNTKKETIDELKNIITFIKEPLIFQNDEDKLSRIQEFQADLNKKINEEKKFIFKLTQIKDLGKFEEKLFNSSYGFLLKQNQKDLYWGDFRIDFQSTKINNLVLLRNQFEKRNTENSKIINDLNISEKNEFHHKFFTLDKNLKSLINQKNNKNPEITLDYLNSKIKEAEEDKLAYYKILLNNFIYRLELLEKYNKEFITFDSVSYFGKVFYPKYKFISTPTINSTFYYPKLKTIVFLDYLVECLLAVLLQFGKKKIK